MRFIAHRGNITGADPAKENRLEQIDLAIKHGFDVEIDVRLYKSKIYLGHDFVQEQVPETYLDTNRASLWIHAKNLVTFLHLLNTKPDLNIFSHDLDDLALTSKGYIWTHPRNVIFLPNSIALTFEYKRNFIKINKNIFGVCSDNPNAYRDEYNQIV